MSGTYRASLSIRLPQLDRTAGGSVDRWARVDLEDHFWLGRCSICNLVVQGDNLISRLHATIQREGDVYRLTDMQSMNGSTVNGTAVKSCVLRPGDRIELGETRIMFTPQRPDDTLFEANSTRTVGSTTLTLRSFPSSLTGVFRVPGEPPAQARAVEDSASPPQPQPTMSFRADESMADVRMPAPPIFVPDAVPPLEEFLTIVIDRIVSELRARVGVIHVPSVAGSAAVSIARGWVDSRLGVLQVPPELPARVEKVLPMAVLQPDGGYLEVGEVLQWKERLLHRRVKPGERFPQHSGSGWEVTVPLPRVGRVDTDLKSIRVYDGMAWIHVELEDRSPDSSYPRIAEVAGGVSASMIRYLERGRAAGS